MILTDYHNPGIARAAREMTIALDRPGYPELGICSHLGVSRMEGCDAVGAGVSDGRLLVTIYRKADQYRGRELVGYSKKVHQRHMEEVALALGVSVAGSWNGEEGHTGISIVLLRNAPAALRSGIHNYHALGNVFDLSEDERKRFRQWGEWYLEGLPVSGGPVA